MVVSILDSGHEPDVIRAACYRETLSGVVGTTFPEEIAGAPDHRRLAVGGGLFHASIAAHASQIEWRKNA